VDREADRPSWDREIKITLRQAFRFGIQVAMVLAIWLLTLAGLALVEEVAHAKVWCGPGGPVELSYFGAVFAEFSPVPGIVGLGVLISSVLLLVSEAIVFKGTGRSRFMQVLPLFCGVLLFLVGAAQLAVVWLEGGIELVAYFRGIIIDIPLDATLCGAFFVTGAGLVSLFHYYRRTVYLLFFAIAPIVGIAAIAVVSPSANDWCERMGWCDMTFMVQFVEQAEYLVIGLAIVFVVVLVPMLLMKPVNGPVAVAALIAGLWGYGILAAVANGAISPAHMMCFTVGFDEIHAIASTWIIVGFVLGWVVLGFVQWRRFQRVRAPN